MRVVLNGKIRIILIVISSLAVTSLITVGVYYIFSPPIKDEVLRTEILKELDLGEHQDDSSRPNKNDLQKLKTLTIEGSIEEEDRVSRLNGLQHAVNLEELVINRNHIENVKPLKKLTKLHTLNLSFEVDEDRSYIEYSDYVITDITPLKNMKSLKKLHLSSNKIENFSALAELTQLEELYLRKNSLDKLPNEIKHLTKLKVLDVNSNSFKDVEPLKGLTSLEKLYIGDTTVTDFSPLRNLTSLTELYMRNTNTELKDISFLEELDNLTILDITIGYRATEDKVDASPVNHLKNLEELIVIDSNIDNLEFISSLTNLKYAQILRSNLTSLKGVEDVQSLESLRVTSSDIKSLEPLKALTEIKSIDMQYNAITSLKPLKKLENLERINVSHNEISSLGPLKNMKKLKYLNMERNNLSTFDRDVMKKVIFSNNKDIEIKM